MGGGGRSRRGGAVHAAARPSYRKREGSGPPCSTGQRRKDRAPGRSGPEGRGPVSSSPGSGLRRKGAPTVAACLRAGARIYLSIRMYLSVSTHQNINRHVPGKARGFLRPCRCRIMMAARAPRLRPARPAFGPRAQGGEGRTRQPSRAPAYEPSASSPSHAVACVCPPRAHARGDACLPAVCWMT